MSLLFWVIKILTTAQGEALSDYMVHTIDPYLAVAIGSAGFLAGMAMQLVVKRYLPFPYWLAVTMVAIFGTMCADAAHIVLDIPYWLSALICAAGLAVVFGVWYAFEHTLSIHSVFGGRRELFYWAAVLATFAMGTAAGDLSAYTMHLGFFVSGLAYTAVFAIPFGIRRLGGGEVFTFWFAYIFTRPIGASYADWLGVPKELGGLDFGRGTVSIALTLAILVLVAYVSVSARRQPATGAAD